VFCTGCLELGRKLCALCEGYCSNSKLFALCEGYGSNSKLFALCEGYCSNSNLCALCEGSCSNSNLCALVLTMGIMMPETCRDRSLIINIGLVAYCWFSSLHPTFHEALSQEPKTYMDCVQLHCFRALNYNNFKFFFFLL